MSPLCCFPRIRCLSILFFSLRAFSFYKQKHGPDSNCRKSWKEKKPCIYNSFFFNISSPCILIYIFLVWIYFSLACKYFLQYMYFIIATYDQPYKDRLYSSIMFKCIFICINVVNSSHTYPNCIPINAFYIFLCYLTYSVELQIIFIFQSK